MRKFAALLIAIILVAGLWIGGWFWAAGEIRNQVALLAQNDGEVNPKITCGDLNVTGFPFRFDIECVDGTLTQLDTTVTLAGLRASVLAYNPTHVLLSAKAPLAIVDAFSGAQSRVDFTGLQASARLTSRDLFEGLTGVGWRIANLSLVADGLTWNDTVVGDMLRMSADHLEAHLVDLPEGRFETRLLRVVTDTQFSPFIYLVNNVQYDSVSQVLGWQARFRWIVRPGNDVFVVYTHNWIDSPVEAQSRFRTLDRRAAAKVVYTKRF